MPPIFFQSLLSIVLSSHSRLAAVRSKMSAPLPLTESRGSTLIVGQWTTVSIASVLVVLRIYARAILRKIAGADDWTIVIALVILYQFHQKKRNKWKKKKSYLPGREIEQFRPADAHFFIFSSFSRPSPSRRASSQSSRWTTAWADTSADRTRSRLRSAPPSS